MPEHSNYQASYDAVADEYVRRISDELQPRLYFCETAVRVPGMAMKKHRLTAPETCPVCGEDVPRGALACPGCGADHNSGWREDAGNYDGLDLPDDSFDYDEFVQREFGSNIKPAGIKTIWWITAIIVLAISVALYFLSR